MMINKTPTMARKVAITNMSLMHRAPSADTSPQARTRQHSGASHILFPPRSPKSRVLNSRKINQNRSRISRDYNDGQVVALFDLGSPRKPWKPRERVRRHSFSIPDWPSSRMRTLLRVHLVNHVRDLAAQIAHRAAERRRRICGIAGLEGLRQIGLRRVEDVLAGGVENRPFRRQLRVALAVGLEAIDVNLDLEIDMHGVVPGEDNHAPRPGLCGEVARHHAREAVLQRLAPSLVL